MILESAFRDLLADLYAGVTDPERLRRFMSGVANSSGSHTVGFTRRNHMHRTGAMLQAVGDVDDVDILLKYEAEFIGTAENLWFERSSPHIHTGSIINGDDWATTQEMKRTRYYADFLRTIDTIHSVAMCSFLRGPHAAMLSFCRSESNGAFGTDELRLFSELSPHWVNAYSLLTQHEEFQTFADACIPAMFSLDAGLRWVSGNSAAAMVISAGWWRGRLGCHIEPTAAQSRAAWFTLQRELREPLASRVSRVIPIYDRAGTLVAFASMRPYGTHAPGEGLPAYVLVVRPLRIACEGDLSRALRSIFSLTDAEALLAMAMRDKDDIACAADTVGIGENSARTRLQAIYDKTGAHRQSELLRLLDALAETLA